MRDILREERELIEKEAERVVDLLNENEEAVPGRTIGLSDSAREHRAEARD